MDEGSIAAPTVSSALEGKLLYNVKNAPVRDFPYPHIYVPEVFPKEFYAEIQANIPRSESMIPIAEARSVRGYEERFVLDVSLHSDRLTPTQQAFWSGMNQLLRGGAFRHAMVEKFETTIKKRFTGQKVKLTDEILLVEDHTKYALGPHSDAIPKVVTVLFYLPRDESQSHLGTSIYMPKDRAWRCPGGPHHKFDGFDRVATMPFMPNSMFAFVKTDNSFHGVEPVSDPDVRRWLLLYDIKGKVIG